ncbi:discoidin domain-containing protein [Acetivibrio cellulolyticus]|uniref:discoidin domain-containing protein n=1 Tax=Acetivibrio cellulolyticus TaxID=35830 RepID=UPI0002481CBE|nr:discoidin domain-containing protein [Acetivibrio cellulolyticus]
MTKRKRLISMIVSSVLLIHVMISSMLTSFGFNQAEAATEIPSKLIVGDVDGNGTINSIDFALMRMVLLGLKSDFPAEDDLWVSDVTGDGNFNSIDFAYMRMYLLGMLKEFPKKDAVVTPTFTPTVTPTKSPTPTVTPTKVPTPTVTPTKSPTPTVTPTVPLQTLTPIPNDVARNKIAACSSYTGNGFEADKALDGILNTMWSAKGLGQWIRIDLGNEFTINKTEFVAGENKAYKYKIEASMDDENYAVIVDKTSNTMASDTYTDSLKETKARFIKLTLTGSADGTVSVKELRVFRTTQTPFPSILPLPSPIIVTDYIRPYVTLNLQTEKVSVNGSVQITAAASDDVGVVSKTLKVNGTVIALNEQGIATYTPKTAGVYKVEFLADDKAGNQGYTSKELRCVTTSDGAAPQASIASPEFGGFAGMPIEIKGTAKDANICNYVLEYSEKGKNNYIRFAEGTTNVEAGVLGKFDPNVVKKGLYDLRLTVYDNGGLSSQAATTVLAEGKMSLRKFSVAYTDISIPVVNGMPLEMKRYYDSTCKTKGDFGYGWTSEIEGIRLTEISQLTEGWSKNSALGVYFVKEDKPHYIVVTYPDGKTDKFLVKLKNIEATDPMGYYSLGTEGIGSFEVIFEPISGTYSKLTAENTEVHIYDNLSSNVFGLWQYPIYDFSEEVYKQGKYTLTTQDGTVIKFDASGKVESLNDSYGAKIVPQTDGLQYTRGTVTKKLTYSKPDGVINSASDLKQNGVVYEYDQYGDLVSFTDLEKHKTKFIYDSQHRMTKVINADNELITKNVYDETGRLVYVYDAANRKSEFKQETVDSKEIITVIDRRGNPTIYTFKADGNLESVEDAEHNTTSYAYKENGLVDTVKGPKGNFSYTYEMYDNGTIKKTTITDEKGNYVESYYDEKGNIDTICDFSNPSLKLVDNDYDANGRLSQTKDGEGGTTILGYDSGNRIGTVTDQMNKKILQFHYDSVTGNLDTQTDALGVVTSFKEYDANGRWGKAEFTRTISEGITEIVSTSNIYDNMGRVTENTDGVGRVSKAYYNGIGKIGTYTDKYQNTLSYQYDCLGNLTQVDYPDKSSEKYTYDEEGNVSSYTDRDSKTVYYTYDAMNRVEYVIYQDGSYVKYDYNEAGKIKKVTDQRGNSTENKYDSLGRLEYVFNSAKPEDKVQYIYSNKPYPDEMLDAKGNKFVYSYNSNGKLETIKYLDDTTYEILYDNAGRVSIVTDQNKKATKYDYKDNGLLEKVTLAYGIEGKEETWIYDYDEAGNLKSIEDPRGKVTKMESDGVGRLKRQTLALKMYMEASYDDEKREVTVTDYNKKPIVYKYDANMRLDIKEVGSENTIDFDYTNEGYIKKVEDKNGTTSYEYDDLYRLTKKTNPDNTTIEYFYDWAGNFTGIRTKGGATSYVYDAYNRLSKVIGNDNKATKYLYDAVGNLEYILHQDGYKTQYIYDNQNRLTDINRLKPDGVTVEYNYHYQLGFAGERKKLTETSGRIVEYDYDDCYRLKKEEITDPVLGNRLITYQYDKAGNRLEKNDNGVITKYDPDDNNRIKSEGSIIYDYDDNGNLKTKVDGTKTTTYGYDGENRLISVTETDSGKTNVETYEYDWEGNRISKTRNGVKVKYLVDSNGLAQVIEERDSKGNLLVYYTYGNDLISQTRGNVTSYYHYDGIGSTRRLTDKDGNVTDTYIYDAFGNLLNRTGNTENSYMFAGEQYDANSGLYYLRARYMNPQNGNFITMDPYSGSLNDPTSLHKYLYANASPVNFTDPTGYFSIPELMISFDINGVLDTLNCVALSALRNAAIGAVAGAVFGGVEAQINGRNIIEGVINGSISGAAYSELVTFAELRLLLGVIGVKDGVEGVFAAIEDEDYNLAAARAGMCLLAVLSLKSEMFNKTAGFNCAGVGNKGQSNVSKVFWASGQEAKTAAEQFALKNGGKTLEMTFTGKILEKGNSIFGFNNKILNFLWGKASVNFANKASGSINVIIKDSTVNPKGVFNNTELPILWEKLMDGIVESIKINHIP